MKADSKKIAEAIGKINSQSSFINDLLKDALQWPIDDSIQKVEDISYSWTAEELNAEGLDKETVSSDIWQIQPLRHGQPWGIFILEFKKPDMLTGARGLTGNLRKLLRGLVAKRRKQPNQPVWRSENLLFICTHKYQHFKFAYFKEARNWDFDPGRESPLRGKIPADAGKAAPLVTFGWGPDTPARTACEFNLPVLAWPEDGVSDADWIKKWAEAFDVEAVTKEFFTEYHNVFNEVEGDKGITGIKDKEKKRLFTQKLFNRLLFIAFIQKKGWLKLNGISDYLNALWEESKKANEENFYFQRLKLLFFQGLNAPNEVNIIGINNGGLLKQLIGQVPYLNGGLFEEDDEDRDANITIPNQCFDRIFALFNRFNFTVTESTPLDMEVAVDPEMLGKVFEELVTGRHESGSYYTPKPIVSFMCREGLKGYLAGRLGKESEEAIGRFVDENDSSELKNPEAVLDAIRKVKVCDPACGSGAYLVGMLHELLELRQALFVSNKLGVKEGYDRKLEIIENNLYGVDYDQFAVNIARLRLWLSLAVEYDGDAPPPLPNLDYKIEQGNSVTALIPKKNQAQSFRDKWVNEYRDKKAQYITAHHGEKLTLRGEIEKLRKSISENDHFVHHGQAISGFDWHVEYAEVFLPSVGANSFAQGAAKAAPDGESGGVPGGFDIVVANPPYVRQELIKEIKPLLKKTFGDFFSGTADLYCFFYFRALELLAPKGMLVFISSNKWFRAKYGDKLKEHIAATCRIHSITDFGDLPVFVGASAYPMIFIAQKQDGAVNVPIFSQVKSLEAPYPDMLGVTCKYGQKLPEGAINGAEWRLSDVGQLDRIRKMEAAGIPLGEYVQGKMYRGILTGFNEAFVIDGAKRTELIDADPKNAEIIKPLVRGKDLKRWRVERKDMWLIYIPWHFPLHLDPSIVGASVKAENEFKKKYPAIFAHLQKYRKELSARNKAETGVRYEWYALQRWGSDYWQEFDKPKIVLGRFMDKPTYAYDENGLYTNDALYIIAHADKYLVGILNSSQAWWYLTSTCTDLQNGFLQAFVRNQEKIPIPNATAKEKAAIAALVQKCLDAKGQNCSQWESEINSLVSSLYGL